MSDLMIQLIPMELIQLLLLLAIIPLARRLSPKLAVVWIICSLFPIFGVVTFYVLVVRMLAALWDRLETLKPAT